MKIGRRSTRYGHGYYIGTERTRERKKERKSSYTKNSTSFSLPADLGHICFSFLFSRLFFLVLFYRLWIFEISIFLKRRVKKYGEGKMELRKEQQTCRHLAAIDGNGPVAACPAWAIRSNLNDMKWFKLISCLFVQQQQTFVHSSSGRPSKSESQIDSAESLDAGKKKQHPKNDWKR